MSSVSSNILFTASSVLVFGALVAMLLATLLWRSNDSTAKFFAVAGIVILLTIQVGQSVLSLVVSRMATGSQTVVFYGVFSLVSTIFYLCGIGLLLLAAFHGRRVIPMEPQTPPTGARASEDNPYVPPAN
ncbi:MAG: hypothetical protein ACR2NZ_18710 [Rubripirellula sp.]